MGSGIARMLGQEPVEVWQDVNGIIAAFTSQTGAYTVTIKGVDVGPVWSINRRRHAVGATVRVLMRGGAAVGLVP